MKNVKKIFVGVFAVFTLCLLQSFRKSVFNGTDCNHIPGITSLVNTTFATVDAETSVLVPANKMYLRNEAIELRKKLEEMHTQSPDNISVNMALVRFHACAPNFVGGFKGVALQHAASIYRQNAYIGCLAYEYIYVMNNDMKNAESWYRLSLACQLQDGMEWRELIYPRPPIFGVGVKGNFTNGRVQPLYMNSYGTYKRKVMLTKCVGSCDFTFVPDYLRGANSAATGRLLFAPY